MSWWRNGLQLYVSDWAGRSIRVVDPGELHTVARIPVGEHPTQIAVHPSDDRIFVACASSNCVSVIDTRRGIVTETINTALFPLAPEGSTPDALAVAPDGKTLFVANADNNNVAVIDIATPSRSQVKGFIPTGWYPTSVAVTPDGKQLLIGVGKGLQTKANPISTAKPRRGTTGHAPPAVSLHRHNAFGLALDRAVPDDKALAAYTETVYKNCPYSDKLLTRCPLPRENRDSDQGGRSVADQVRVVHHQGESHLRSGVRRHAARQRRPVARDVWQGRLAQPSQAGRGVRLARQPLLQRPRLGRRTPVVDDGL